MQGNYIQPYDPPTIVQFVGSLFGSLSHSTLVMFTSDYEAQALYIKEILGVATIFFSIWLVWTCLLLICRVNCVSDKLCFCQYQTSNSPISKTSSLHESLDERSGIASNCSSVVSPGGESLSGSGVGTQMEGNNGQENSNFQPALQTIQEHKNIVTRVAFLIFSTISILSGTFVFGKASFPAISAFETTEHLIEEAQLILTTTQRAIRVIEETFSVSTQIEVQMQSNLISLCPGLPPYYLSYEFGVDPNEFVALLERGNSDFLTFFQFSANRALKIISDIDAKLQNAKDGIQVGQDWIWILSLLMFCLTTMNVVCLLSMFWAISQEKFQSWYDEQSQKRWESILSWGAVPLVALLTALVWGSVMLMSIGAIAVTDICLPTPDDSILFVLGNIDNPFFKPRVMDTMFTYMTGCQGDDPLYMLHALEGSLNGVLGMIDDHLEDILTEKYPHLDEACGPENKLDSFFASMSQLSYYLHNAYDAVLDTHAAVDCPHVNEIYTAIFHDAMCSELAGALSYGFVLVLVVAISSLLVLTFRGAWNYVKLLH